MTKPSILKYDLERPVDVSNITSGEYVIPSIPGVYFIFCKYPDVLFGKDYPKSSAKTEVDSMELIYIGSTDGSLQDRIHAHIARSSMGSSFRRTIGALLSKRLNINALPTTKVHFSFGEGESRLTDWISANCSLAYLPSSEPKRTERFLVRLFRPTINVSYRRVEIGARHLMEVVGRARKGWAISSTD